MHFHATAAAVSVRSKRISTLRNRLLCSVCTAMLLTGSGGMALTHPSAEPSATAQPVTGTAAPIEKVSDPKPVGSRPKIDDLAVKQGDDRYFVEDEIGTATVAGRLTVSGESTVTGTPAASSPAWTA